MMTEFLTYALFGAALFLFLVILRERAPRRRTGYKIPSSHVVQVTRRARKERQQ